jgi:hypothetical protein
MKRRERLEKKEEKIWRPHEMKMIHSDERI